jgi:hypothetical protein
MRMWAKNTSRAALVAAGAVAVGAAFGSGAAIADTTTSGNFSVLGGNQVVAPISVPIEASGNSVAALGASQAQSEGGAHVSGARHGGGGDMQTSGNFSIGGGNQVVAPISLPVDVCGNSIAILGLSRAQCKGGASVTSGGSHGGYAADPGYRTSTTGWGGGNGGNGGWDQGGMTTSGNFSVLGGNQVYAPISVPVNVCGNSVAVLGASQAQCKGGASVKRTAGHDPKMTTSGNFSVLGGNQIYAPISIPVNVCGNSVAVLGLSQAQCKGGATVGGGDEELPPTLRTPPVKKHKKPYKPSKHRPAAKHKKLPSTLRAGNSRMASPVPGSTGGDALSPVKKLLNTVKGLVKLPGTDVQPGQLGPQLPSEGGAPVRLGTPVLH